MTNQEKMIQLTEEINLLKRSMGDLSAQKASLMRQLEEINQGLSDVYEELWPKQEELLILEKGTLVVAPSKPKRRKKLSALDQLMIEACKEEGLKWNP